LKTLATIALSFVVLITAFACFWFSICAVGGDGGMGGTRMSYAVADAIDIAIMIGAFLLIAKLNKRKPNT
jgi:hypothetical protein